PAQTWCVFILIIEETKRPAMKIAKLIAAVSVFGVLSFVMLFTRAHALSFDLNQDGCTNGCGTGSTILGTVSLNQGADAKHVNVTVKLNPGNAFVDSGAGESVEFNISGHPAIKITNLTSGFVAGPAPPSAGTFGSFDYSITCAGNQTGHCGPGASVTVPAPLSFTGALTRGGNLSPSDFIS